MVSLHLNSCLQTINSNSLLKLYLILTLLYINNLSQSVITANRRASVENIASLAFEHGVHVREEAACRLPKAQVVYVNTTDPSKVYLPRGTLLHRCSDLTGCCSHATQTCQPIQMTTIELYFFTVTLQINPLFKTQHRVRQHQRIEKLLFTNHTLCGCRHRNIIDSTDESDNEI